VLTQTVGKAATSTALTVSQNPTTRFRPLVQFA
jgi:hypothetical protein